MAVYSSTGPIYYSKFTYCSMYSMWILSGADRELVQCAKFIPNKESEKLLRIRTWNLINCHLTE